MSESSGYGAENELSDHETALASRGQVRSRGVSGLMFESNVLDGALSALVDFALQHAMKQQSSTAFGGKEEKEKDKDAKWVQIFVNRGKGFTTVVRCSPDAVLSEVLHLDADEFALWGSRFVKVGCTIGEKWIGIGSNVQVLRRLGGGAGAYLDIPGH